MGGWRCDGAGRADRLGEGTVTRTTSVTSDLGVVILSPVFRLRREFRC